MRGLLLTPLAPLLELDLTLHKFAVLAAPVVYTLTFRTSEFYELFLRHA